MSQPAPARIAVEQVGGRPRLRGLTASRFLRPRLLGSEDGRARVALVAACASLLAHDELRLEVEVGPGADLELIEPSGTVAYDGRGGRAHWHASVRVATGGRLVWGGAPFVVAHGADVTRHTEIALERDAMMLLRETLVLGRSGESAGALTSRLRARREDRPLLVEDLALDEPALRASPAVLGRARVLATATLLGTRPPDTVHPHETLLAGPGAQHREISGQAHRAESALALTWARWRDLIHGRSGDGLVQQSRVPVVEEAG